MYKKIDLHVHTPRSVCYLDYTFPEANRHTKPEDVVQAALDAGLDAIAITDHNTCDGVEAIKRVAKGNGLCIFPGMEISCRGGHVLAIFNPEAPMDTLRDLVRALGFKEQEEGDGFIQSSLFMVDVFQLIAERRGMAIAAHIDRRPRGFTASDESLSDKRLIHSSPHLSALEITVPQDKDLWKGGRMPNYPKRYPCIQDSDAHAPEEIGRRFTCFYLPSTDLEGLRVALKGFEDRVKFPDEVELKEEPGG